MRLTVKNLMDLTRITNDLKMRGVKMGNKNINQRKGIKKIMGIIMKVLLGLILLIIIIVCIFLVYRYIHITNLKKEHAITSESGIDEEVVTKIGGIEQYMYIRGQNTDNPIILVLHGGMPLTPMIHTYQYAWEDKYTVVNWDRRGCGETYFLNEEKSDEIVDSMTFDVLLEDTNEVVEYLTKRFGQKKVIIMADSFGSMIGSQYVQKYPEKVSAYIGSAQITDIIKDINLCAVDLKERAIQAGNTNDAEKLSTYINLDDKSNFLQKYLAFNEFANSYITHESFADTLKVYLTGLESPYFPISHLSFYFKTDRLSARLVELLSEFNIKDYGNVYQVPMIYILGEKDWITTYAFEEYYNTVEAPYKKVVYIANGGHDVLQNDPEEYYEAFNSALEEAAISINNGDSDSYISEK